MKHGTYSRPDISERRTRPEKVESCSRAGNDRLGWQLGVCHALQSTAAGAWVGPEPVKLQWDPTWLPTPSSFHLSTNRLSATPPSIYRLRVRVKAIQFTKQKHTHTWWNSSVIITASRAHASWINTGLKCACDRYSWNSFKDRKIDNRQKLL